MTAARTGPPGEVPAPTTEAGTNHTSRDEYDTTHATGGSDATQIQPVGPHPSVDVLFIGSLLWAPISIAVSVLGLVDDDDVEHPADTGILAAIRTLALANKPTGPQLVFDELKRTGAATALVLDHLRAAVTSGAEALAVDAYAAAVVASRFRRLVSNVGNAMMMLADLAPEADIVQVVTSGAARITETSERLAVLRGEL